MGDPPLGRYAVVCIGRYSTYLYQYDGNIMISNSIEVDQGATGLNFQWMTEGWLGMGELCEEALEAGAKAMGLESSRHLAAKLRGLLGPKPQPQQPRSSDLWSNGLSGFVWTAR